MTSNFFPIRPVPEEGEIFTSWTARVAFAHGISLNGLLTYLHPRSFFYKRDIDKYANTLFMQRMADGTKTDLAVAQKTSLLLKVLPISAIQENPYNAEWVTHVSNIYTKTRTFGLCFCPLCLCEDKEPYFRLKWRLSFVTMCEKHNTLLNNKCPSCKQEINLYRLTVGVKNLATCCWCGDDIRRGQSDEIINISYFLPLQQLMERLLQKLHDGTKDAGHIKTWFSTLYHITYLVMHCWTENELKKHQKVQAYLGIPTPHAEHRKTFDMYEVVNRLIILNVAYSVLQVDRPCNLTKYFELQGKGALRTFHKVKKMPCEKWCKSHDFLDIASSCDRWLSSFLLNCFMHQKYRFDK